jgi:hypothetical protein
LKDTGTAAILIIGWIESKPSLALKLSPSKRGLENPASMVVILESPSESLWREIDPVGPAPSYVVKIEG